MFFVVAGNVTANTIQNMKEFQQNTVNSVVKPLSQATTNAKHKIGDLQVLGCLKNKIGFKKTHLFLWLFWNKIFIVYIHIVQFVRFALHLFALKLFLIGFSLFQSV